MPADATGKRQEFRFASPAEAVAAVRAELTSLSVERIELAVSLGRILAEPIAADCDSPALDVSAMDGFAISAAWLNTMATDGLPIAAVEARIGCPPVALPSTPNAVRIVTGAAVPTGADCVIRREDLVESAGRVRLTIQPAAVKPNGHIRRRGENARDGAPVLPPGVILSAAAIGALASFGVANVPVHRRVRVGIISTGDELVSLGEKPEPWQLRDSNGPSLAALFGARPWIEVVARAQVRDEGGSEGGLAKALRCGLETADAVILSGGVSMGHRDFVPSVVESLGARTIFHKLPQRPGKPMLAAVLSDKSANRGGTGDVANSPAKVILGLPGNPVSVLATGRRLALPILAKLAGLPDTALAAPHRTIEPDGLSLELWWHRLVREELTPAGTPTLWLVPPKSSGDIVAAAGACGFVEVPPQQTGPGPWPFYAWDG